MISFDDSQKRLIKKVVLLIVVIAVLFPISVPCGGRGSYVSCSTPPDKEGAIHIEYAVQPAIVAFINTFGGVISENIFLDIAYYKYTDSTRYWNQETATGCNDYYAPWEGWSKDEKLAQCDKMADRDLKYKDLGSKDCLVVDHFVSSCGDLLGTRFECKYFCQ